VKTQKTSTTRIVKALESGKGITCAQAVSRFNMTPAVFYATIHSFKKNKKMDVRSVPNHKGLNRYYVPASVAA